MEGDLVKKKQEKEKKKSGHREFCQLHAGWVKTGASWELASWTANLAEWWSSRVSERLYLKSEGGVQSR